jgi:hypothetical protein
MHAFAASIVTCARVHGCIAPSVKTHAPLLLRVAIIVDACVPRLKNSLAKHELACDPISSPTHVLMYICVYTYTARTHACCTRRFLCKRPRPHTHTHTHTRLDTHTHTVSCYCCCRYALVRSMSSSTRTVSSYAGPTQSPKSPFNLEHVRTVDPQDRVRFQVSTRIKTQRNRIANRQSTQLRAPRKSLINTCQVNPLIQEMNTRYVWQGATLVFDSSNSFFAFCFRFFTGSCKVVHSLYLFYQTLIVSFVCLCKHH